MANFQTFAAGFVPSGTMALFMIFTTAISTAEWKRVCANVFKMAKFLTFAAGFVPSRTLFLGFMIFTTAEVTAADSFVSANGSKMTTFLAFSAGFVSSGTLALCMFFFTTRATFELLLVAYFTIIAFFLEIAPITLAFCRIFPVLLVVKADGWVWAGIPRLYRRHIVFYLTTKSTVKNYDPTKLFQAYFPT